MLEVACLYYEGVLTNSSYGNFRATNVRVIETILKNKKNRKLNEFELQENELHEFMCNK